MNRQTVSYSGVDRKHFRSDLQSGFTLIELLVVVAVLAMVSAILLPVLFQAADRARKVAAQQALLKQESPQTDTEPAFPSGPRPILDSVDLKMALASSYHRIGMDVFTRYRVDCTGQIVFRRPEGTNDNRVALIIPFPDNTLEARDVQLKVFQPGSQTPLPLTNVVYSRKGIYCVCSSESQEPLTADVSFTALGREQFDYTLPPAQQLRSVAITLNLSGTEARTLPDDSLQPSFTGPNQLRWEFKNLVSDRQITVLIPGAEAPLARVMLLSRLVALAVLLFGAGFWYLSEQVKPGRLDRFRFAHFLLLALTYSLFFVIFAVLGFHGQLETPVAMAIAAACSLPLLVLHTARILDLRFAITRVVPLAVFTVGLVVNGVYGTELRDYVFIGAASLVLAYVTLSYQAWTAGRERYYQRAEITYADLAELVGREALLTHRDPLSGDVAAAVVLLCRALVRGTDWQEALALAAIGRQPVTQAALQDSLQTLHSRGGYAPETLQAALCFVSRHTEAASALQASIAFAGPANYCSVLVGAIAGARWGTEGLLSLIPFELQTEVQNTAKALANSWPQGTS